MNLRVNTNFTDLNTNPETMVNCPFEIHHKMPLRTLASHITTCPKRFNYEYKRCIYNSIHVISPDDYNGHLNTCPDKNFYRNDEIIKNTVEINKKENCMKLINNNDMDEDWDKECINNKPALINDDIKKNNDQNKENKGYNKLLHEIPDEIVIKAINDSIKYHKFNVNLEKEYSDEFDYISLLNEYSQKIRSSNANFHQASSIENIGSYTFSCTYKNKKVYSKGNIKTKQRAKQNSAKYAYLLANVRFLPDPYKTSVLSSINSKH